MTKSIPDPGILAENVCHNEKGIDRIDADIRALREEMRTLSTKIDSLSDRVNRLGWKGLIAIIIVIAVQVLTRVLPSAH